MSTFTSFEIDLMADLSRMKLRAEAAEKELSTLRAKLEAVEQRIRESQEQEPVEVASMGSAILFFKGNKQLASRPKLYLSPIIPPTLEELQRENAELKRKLDSINLPESAYCAAGVEPCACAVANNLDATRYRFLRNQDIETDFPRSGLFIGKIPSNECLTGLDADLAIDAELKRKLAEISPSK